MKRYNEYDLSFYTEEVEGDIVIDETGDLQLTEEYESARQDISNRARTQTTDWRSHPKIGGDLELLEGEPNTRETAAKGVEQLLATLTFDGRFSSVDLTIRPVPTSIYQIDYFIFLNAGEDGIVVQQSQSV